MKKLILLPLLIFSLALVTPVSTSFAVVETQEETSGSDADQKIKKQELTDRIEERKKQVESTITESKEDLIAKKCEAAQEMISKSLTRINTVSETRNEAYTNIVNKLNNLATRLADNDIDNSSVIAAADEIEKLATDFNGLIDGYVQDIEDATSINCVNNPNDFYVTLESARESIKDLKAKAVEIKNYVKQDIKQVLMDLKDELSNDDSTESRSEVSEVNGEDE